jgi:hypothetical protein
MKHDESILEAEVVEIDGVAVDPRPAADWYNGDQKRRVDWQGWQGKIRVLDKRWMPLWIVLGLIALILAVTVGLLVGVFVFIFWSRPACGLFDFYSIRSHAQPQIIIRIG